MLRTEFLLLLAATFCLACAKRFVIPKVKIELLEPCGFRLSIPDEEGIELFSFHGSFNTPISNFEVGDYYEDVRKPINGRWIYEDKTRKLKNGDILYYWVYVVYEKLGFRRDNQIYVVQELDRNKSPELIDEPHADNDRNEVPTEKVDRGQPPVSSTDLQQAQDQIQLCLQNVLKLMPRLMKLEDDLHLAKKQNEFMMNLVERLPNSKKLTMQGHLSIKHSPTWVVKFMLNEKLDLKPTIVSATKNEDQSITFELATVADMLMVLQTAEEKLKGSKVLTITF